GRDYVYPGGSGGRLSNMKNEFTGNGPFLHDDPRDRPMAIYGGETTIHLGKGENFVLLPIIPEKAEKAKASRRLGKAKGGHRRELRRMRRRGHGARCAPLPTLRTQRVLRAEPSRRENTRGARNLGCGTNLYRRATWRERPMPDDISFWLLWPLPILLSLAAL